MRENCVRQVAEGDPSALLPLPCPTPAQPALHAELPANASSHPPGDHLSLIRAPNSRCREPRTRRWRIGDSNSRSPRRRDNRRDLSQLSAAAAFSAVVERTGLNAGCPSALFEEAAALYSCGSRDRTGIAK